MADDLVPVATIFSRPELVCFVSALEDWGIHCCIVGNHYGNATQLIVAMVGYSVRVPETDLVTAMDLIDELRGQTAPIAAPKSLKRRIWVLFALLWLSVVTYPFPVTMPGDYLNRRGKLVQMR